MRQKITLLILGCLFFIPLPAQELHCIFFAATQDKQIGEGVSVSLQHLQQQMTIAAEQTGLNYRESVYTDSRFSATQLDEVLNNTTTSTQDVLLFYFIGHGVQDEVSSYPNLVFLPSFRKNEVATSTRNLKTIYDRLVEGQNARLMLVVGEACNDRYAPVGAMGLDLGADEKRPRQEQFRQLFLQEEGSYLLASSKPGQKSYMHREKGGLFTQAFINAMNTVLAENEPATMNRFMRRIRNETSKLTQKIEQEPLIEEKRPNFFSRLLTVFLDWKTRRTLKREIKDGNLENLEQILSEIHNPNSERDKLLREKFIEKRPVSFYVIKGIFTEANLNSSSMVRDSGQVLVDYCTAAYLYSEGMRSSRDYRILQDIEETNAKHGDPLGIEAEGGMVQWLGNRCTNYENYFTGEKEEIDEKIEALNAEIIRIEQEIGDDQRRILSLGQENKESEATINANLNEIQSNEDYIRDNGDLSFQIPALPGSTTAIRALEKLQRGENADEDLSEEDRLWLSGVRIKSEPNDSLTGNMTRAQSLKAYRIGDYCSEQIVETAEGVMSLLLKQIEEVPFSYRPKVRVKLDITGYADWRSAGRYKTIGIKVTPDSDINEFYMTKDSLRMPFSVAKGERKSITNEQLAFMRGYCAYETAVEILKRNNITQVEKRFTAIEQDPPANEEEKKGDLFRGIDMFFVVANAFGYLLERNDELRAENEEKRQSIEANRILIRQLEEKIARNENQISNLKQEIVEAEKRKAQIESRLIDIQRGSQGQPIDSEIERRLQEVKKLQGK